MWHRTTDGRSRWQLDLEDGDPADLPTYEPQHFDGTVAVALQDFHGTGADDGVHLTWTVDSDETTALRVLRAGPGETFEPAGAGMTAPAGRTVQTFQDRDAQPATRYQYALSYRQGGVWAMSAPIEIETAASGFTLRQPIPNPSHGEVVLRMSVPRHGPASLAIFDARGRLVRQLIRESSAAGLTEATRDGRDRSERPAPAGTYFARLVSGAQVAKQQIVRVR